MGKILSVKYYQNSGLIALTKVPYYLDKKREKKLCGGTFICMQSWTGILSGRAKRKNIEMKKYHQVLLHSTLRGVRSDQQIMANKPESINISAH